VSLFDLYYNRYFTETLQNIRAKREEDGLAKTLQRFCGVDSLRPGDTLILLYARSVTADGITGGLSDLLANPGDLVHSNPDCIYHSFDAFCIVGRGPDGIE
jgi:hypothetical protein